MYEKHPERLKKIILVPGDTTADDLALSSSDRERLQQEVSVIFHMAANVKFHLTLKDAVSINTLGTMHVLKLAKQVGHTSIPPFNPCSKMTRTTSHAGFSNIVPCFCVYEIGAVPN